MRPWFAVGDIEIGGGQVMAKVFGLQFPRDDGYPEIEVEAWQQRKLEKTICSYYPLKRHPGYAFSNASNRRSFTAWVSDSASAQNQQNAFQLNLRCLTGRHECKQFSELIPAAWADYEEDGKWLETHPSRLVWEVGKPCPY